MSQTLAQLKNQALHYVGDSLDSRLNVEQIVNEAGRYLAGLHAWRFLERAPATISLVQDQADAALPSDFGELIEILMTSGLVGGVQLESIENILEHRQGTLTTINTASYVVAIANQGQASQTALPASPRLEVYPTPTAAASAVFTVYYRADWTELTDDSHIANMPVFMDSLLNMLIRAFAAGYEDDRFTEIIDRIEDSNVMKRAIEKDNRVQPHYGRTHHTHRMGSPGILGVADV